MWSVMGRGGLSIESQGTGLRKPGCNYWIHLLGVSSEKNLWNGSCSLLLVSVHLFTSWLFFSPILFLLAKCLCIKSRWHSVTALCRLCELRKAQTWGPESVTSISCVIKTGWFQKHWPPLIGIEGLNCSENRVTSLNAGCKRHPGFKRGFAATALSFTSPLNK